MSVLLTARALRGRAASWSREVARRVPDAPRRGVTWRDAREPLRTEWIRLASLGELAQVGELADIRDGEEPSGDRHGDAGHRRSWTPDPIDLGVLPRGAYASIRGRAAREALLREAARTARVLIVHARVGGAGPRRSLAVDLPWRALRACGVPAPEPGDTWAPTFAHVFTDERALEGEFAAAGLRVVDRQGQAYVLDRGTDRARRGVRPAEIAREVARAVALAPTAERWRRQCSPDAAVTAMRARGVRGPARDREGRLELRRVIRWVDALLFRQPNCFRRVLLEIGLDARAASEPIAFGLDVGETGHVTFAAERGADTDGDFDVTFTLDP